MLALQPPFHVPPLPWHASSLRHSSSACFLSLLHPLISQTVGGGGESFNQSEEVSPTRCRVAETRQRLFHTPLLSFSSDLFLLSFVTRLRRAVPSRSPFHRLAAICDSTSDPRSRSWSRSARFRLSSGFRCPPQREHFQLWGEETLVLQRFACKARPRSGL